MDSHSTASIVFSVLMLFYVFKAELARRSFGGILEAIYHMLMALAVMLLWLVSKC